MRENNKKSIPDEGSFLKRALSICSNKGRLKIVIFLKLRKASIEEIFLKGRIKLDTFRS